MKRYKKLIHVASRPTDPRIIYDLPGKKTSDGSPVKYVTNAGMIDMLNDAFGPFWSLQFGEPWLSEYPSYETKNGHYTPNRVMNVKAIITVRLIDPETNEATTIIREGYGAEPLAAKNEDRIVKSAETDALKKAAYSFGFALDLARKGGDAAAFNEKHGWTNDSMNAYKRELSMVNSYLNSVGAKSNFDQAKAILDITEGNYSSVTPDNIIDICKVLNLILDRNGKKEKVS